MVMQSTTNLLVGGSNASESNTAAATPVSSRDSNRRPNILRLGALPFDRRWMQEQCVSHWLQPFQQKLLTPPHPVPYFFLDADDFFGGNVFS